MALSKSHGDEYIDEETKFFNKKGLADLANLYDNNKKFRDKIINFVEDKTLLNDEEILGKTFKYNTPNMLGKKYLAKCILSKDYTKNLIKGKSAKQVP